MGLIHTKNTFSYSRGSKESLSSQQKDDLSQSLTYESLNLFCEPFVTGIKKKEFSMETIH